VQRLDICLQSKPLDWSPVREISIRKKFADANLAGELAQAQRLSSTILPANVSSSR
jgi:hypothetical protein